VAPVALVGRLDRLDQIDGGGLLSYASP
jgi:hypothetical protein